MSIFTPDLASHVVRPTLKACDLYTLAAEQLLLGTAAVESDMGTFLHQKGGPALGIYQMEPNTHDDIYINYLKFQPNVKSKILTACEYVDRPKHTALVENLAYATVMARLLYLRVPEKLPREHDIDEMAYYWKKYYNTHLGKGKEEDFKKAYIRHVSYLYLQTTPK